jgi:hypothetical protein
LGLGVVLYVSTYLCLCFRAPRVLPHGALFASEVLDLFLTPFHHFLNLLYLYTRLKLVSIDSEMSHLCRLRTLFHVDLLCNDFYRTAAVLKLGNDVALNQQNLWLRLLIPYGGASCW